MTVKYHAFDPISCQTKIEIKFQNLHAYSKNEKASQSTRKLLKNLMENSFFSLLHWTPIPLDPPISLDPTIPLDPLQFHSIPLQIYRIPPFS